MIQDLFSSGALNIVYVVVLLISFVFAVISLIGGDVTDFDLDADVDANGIDFLSISPFALAMFGAAFGLTGLVTRLWFEMDALPSIAWATTVGLLFGVVAQAFFLYVLSPSKSSHFRLADDAVGREAQVIVTVPPDGLGTIAFDNVSGRVTLGARSATGKAIHNGETVRIESVSGRVASVRPVELLKG